MREESRTIFVVVVLAVVLLAASPELASADREGLATAAGASFATERLEGGTLSFDLAGDFNRATFTLKGSRGNRFTREFTGGKAIAIPLVGDNGAALPDGRYRYTLRGSSKTAMLGLQRGMFFVENGIAVSRGAKRAELASLRADLNLKRSEQAGIQKEKAEAPEQARPDNENLLTASSPWYILGSPSFNSPQFLWGYYYYPFGNTYVMFMGHYNYYPLIPYYGLFNIGNVGNRREIASRGNFNIYAYDYTINGIPVNNGGTVLNYAFTYDLATYEFDYSFLAVTPNSVGINTLYPTAELEIADYYPYPGAGDNGFAALRLFSYQSGYKWAIAATPAGDLTFNKIGTGGQEFSIRDRFDGAGSTLRVQGSVEGTKFVASSSREVKTDFAQLDGKEVLAKLAEVPITSWRYKTDTKDDRHVGPVAEDFHAAFQLGNDKTIANIDADGVALAAIQGLQEVMDEKLAKLTAHLDDRDREIADLRQRLAALEDEPRAAPPGR